MKSSKPPPTTAPAKQKKDTMPLASEGISEAEILRLQKRKRELSEFARKAFAKNE